MQNYVVSFATLLCLGIAARLIHPDSSRLAVPYLTASIFLLAASIISLVYRTRVLAFLFLVAALGVFMLALPLDHSLNYYFIGVFAGLFLISIVLGFMKIKNLPLWMLSALFLGYGITCIHLDRSAPTHLYHWATDDWGQQSLIYGTIVKEPEIWPEKQYTRLTIQPSIVAHLRETGTQGKIDQVIKELMGLGREWPSEEEALHALLLAREKIDALPETELEERKPGIIKKEFSGGGYVPAAEDMEIIEMCLEELGPGEDPDKWISLISKGWILAFIIDNEYQEETYLDISHCTAYGDMVKIIGGLRAPSTASNPGGFNWAIILNQTNYFATMSITGKGSRTREADTIEIIEPRTGNFFVAWCLKIKYKMLGIIRQTTPFPDSGFLGGIFLGLRRGVPEKIVEDSRAAGTAHVFAVSGLHVTLIAAILLLIFNQTPIPKSIWAPIAVLGLVVFTVITGARPSTLRAAIMNSFGLIFFTYFGKNIKKSLVMAICVSGIIILTIIPEGYGGPLLLPSASFLMSFSAVLFLALLSGPVETYLNYRINNLYRIAILVFAVMVVGLIFINLEHPVAIFKAKIFWAFLVAIPVCYGIQQVIPFRPRFSAIPNRWLRTFIAAQFAIQCSIIPLSAVIFHRISLAAPFANFIGIPLIGIILPLGMIATLLGLIPFIGIQLALLLTAGNWLGMHFFIIMDAFFARVFPYPQVPKPGPVSLIAFYALVGAFIYREKIVLSLRIAFLRVKRSLTDSAAKSRVYISSAALIIAAAATTLGFVSARKPTLEVTFLEMGYKTDAYSSGMAALIEAPNGDKILIDGGFEGRATWKKQYVNQGERILQDVLLAKKIISFDAVINSNYDARLMGGLNFIIGSPDYYIKKLYTYLPPSEFGPRDIDIDRFSRALTDRGRKKAKDLYRTLLLNLWDSPIDVSEFKKFYNAIGDGERKTFLKNLGDEERVKVDKIIVGLDEQEAEAYEKLVEAIISAEEKLGNTISRDQARSMADARKQPLLTVEKYRDFITKLPQMFQWFVYQQGGLVDDPVEIEAYRLDLFDKFEEASGEAEYIYRAEEKFLQYHRLIFFVKMKNIPISVASAGMSVIKPVKVGGKELEAIIISPPRARFKGKYVSEANSIITRVKYGNVSFLFPSIINNLGAKELINIKGGIASTIYQVPEFGRGGRFVNVHQMLRAVDPSLAVFQHKGGRYPIKEFDNVREACREKGITCYNTDEAGAVMVTTDGDDFWVRTMLGEEEKVQGEGVETTDKEQEVGGGM